MFFFCKEETETKKVTTTMLSICIIKKKTAEEEKLNSKNITDNVDKVDISNKSDLFELMITLTANEKDQKEQLF